MWLLWITQTEHHQVLLRTPAGSRWQDIFLLLFIQVSKVDNSGCRDNYRFKNALGILAARCTSCNAWHILLCISAILPEAISDGRLNLTTDIILLLTTCRGGSHLTSDITKNDMSNKNWTCRFGTSNYASLHLKSAGIEPQTPLHFVWVA